MDISRLSSQIDAELVDNYGELATRVIATWEHWREVTSDETVAVLQGLVQGFSDELLSDTDEQALVQGVLGSYLACRVVMGTGSRLLVGASESPPSLEMIARQDGAIGLDPFLPGGRLAPLFRAALGPLGGLELDCDRGKPGSVRKELRSAVALKVARHVASEFLACLEPADAVAAENATERASETRSAPSTTPAPPTASQDPVSRLDPPPSLEEVKRHARPFLTSPLASTGLMWTNMLTAVLQGSSSFKRKQRKAFRAIPSGEPYIQALTALQQLGPRRAEFSEMSGIPPEKVIEVAMTLVLMEAHQMDQDTASSIVDLADACLRAPEPLGLEARFELVSHCVSGVPALQRDLFADMPVNIS